MVKQIAKRSCQKLQFRYFFQLKCALLRTEHTLTCQIIMQQILLFFWEKNTYITLLGPTNLLISEVFLSKPDFHLHKWAKILPTRLLIFKKSATYMNKWSYTIIWQVRVRAQIEIPYLLTVLLSMLLNKLPWIASNFVPVSKSLSSFDEFFSNFSKESSATILIFSLASSLSAALLPISICRKN